MEQINYFITCFTKLEQKENGKLEMGDIITFGYYNDYLIAEKALHENWYDMHGKTYNYAIIEGIKPGINQQTIDRSFFKYNKEKEGFSRLPFPKELKNHYNIALKKQI